MMTPALLFTTLCPTSKIPMTIFHVFVTMRTAQKVLKIEKMLESGKSHREIEAELGLEGDRPVHNLLKRQRKKAAKGAPKFRGRKPAKTLQEYKYENKRLKMKVKLLQDFLQSTERK